MSFGIRNDKYEFDIMDNPYINMQLAKAVSDWVISKNEDTFLRKCTDEEAFAANGHWYPTFKGNMVCMNDPKKLKIKSNWYDLDYENPYFMINECINSTTRVCESPEIIEDFIRNMQVVLFKQSLKVNDRIYKEDAKYHRDDGTYFPIEL